MADSTRNVKSAANISDNIPDKPARLRINRDMIPPLMRARKRWVMWRWTWNGKKWDKPPFNVNGRHASSTNPSTWTDFETAWAAYQTGRFDGIGFALGPDSEIGVNWAGVDWDKVIDAAGKLLAGIRFHCRMLDSYTEISPSGTGVKQLVMGNLPPEGGSHGRAGDDGAKIEMYDKGRYFTVTSQHLEGTPLEINERSQELAEMHERFVTKKSERRTRENSEPPEKKPEIKTHANVSSSLGISASDREIAISALTVLGHMADDYNDWLHVGMALKSVSEDLLDEWERWSRQSKKFQEGVCAAKWQTFRRDGLTLGSLIRWAEQTGRWVNPKKRRSASRRKVEEMISKLEEKLAQEDVSASVANEYQKRREAIEAARRGRQVIADIMKDIDDSDRRGLCGHSPYRLVRRRDDYRKHRFYVPDCKCMECRYCWPTKKTKHIEKLTLKILFLPDNEGCARTDNLYMDEFPLAEWPARRKAMNRWKDKGGGRLKIIERHDPNLPNRKEYLTVVVIAKYWFPRCRTVTPAQAFDRGLEAIKRESKWHSSFRLEGNWKDVRYKPFELVKDFEGGSAPLKDGQLVLQLDQITDFLVAQGIKAKLVGKHIAFETTTGDSERLDEIVSNFLPMYHRWKVDNQQTAADRARQEEMHRQAEERADRAWVESGGYDPPP
jgi:hypothetical protein